MEKQSLISRHAWIFFAILAVILLWQNGNILLWNQDEAAYAGFARTMLSSGDWLVPDFMWSDLHRKTPFHFWMIAISQSLFGTNEFATRLSSVVFTFGTFLALYQIGGKIWGKEVSLVACFVMAASVLVPAFGKVAVTDGTLLFWETLCALSILMVLQDEGRKWIILFWFAFAVSLLIKGPPVIIFTGMMGLLLLILHPNGKGIWRLKPWFFLPLALLPLFIWGYAAWQQDDGAFVKWLIDWYILKRVDGNVFGQTGPPGYHLAIILIAFIPFFAFVVRFLIRAFSFKKKDNLLLAGIWMISGWLLYEFSSSKLPSYAIAAHPAVAIGIAHFLSGVEKEQKRQWIRPLLIFQVLLTIAAACFVIFGTPEIKSFALKAGLISYVVFLALCSISLLVFWREDLSKSIQWAFCYLILIPNIIIWAWIIPSTQSSLSGVKEVAEFIHNYDPDVKPDVYIGQIRGMLPGLPFYLSDVSSSITQETDMANLLDAYNSEGELAFILTQAQLEYIQSLSPNVFAQEISTYKIDNQEMMSFFVALNY